MTPAAVELHPDALREIQAAFDWYHSRNPRAAAAFAAEVESAIESVAGDPRRWPSSHHSTRRYLLHRFPFSIVYRETTATVQIIAVAHAKRRPGYWKGR